MNNNIRVHFVLALLILRINASASACATLNSAKFATSSTPNIQVTEKPTLTPVSISTIAPPFQVDAKCWEVKPLYYDSVENFKGSFLVENSGDKIFARDISTLKTKLIVNQPSKRLFLSMNKKITGVMSNDSLTLISSTQTQSFPLPDMGRDKYFGSTFFLSDGRVFFQESPRDHEEDYKNDGFTDIYYIFDPATGKTTKHSVFLPNFEKNSQGFYAIGYSPNIEYVIYRSTPTHKNVDSEYTLYNLETNRVLWIGPDHGSDISQGDGTMLPAWMPDSSALIYIFADSKNITSNYYSVSLDNKLTQLTYFDNLIPYPWQTSPGIGSINTANLSPNGQYLLFFVDPMDGSSNRKLYVWDNQTKTAYTPCLPYEEAAEFDYYTPWSPDSSNVIVNFRHYIPFTTDGPRVISDSWHVVLDLSNKTIFVVLNRNSQGYLTTLSDKGILDWVDWEIP